MSTIFHLDLDAFFISVERILNPQLNGIPVIVGGDPKGRGVVAACSYEARSYGLHSAMPIREAFKLCPMGKYIHGHYEEYIRFSNLVYELLQKHAPIVKKSSVDEFFMDFTGCGKTKKDFITLASFLQYKVWNDLYLPCSIGIASNKLMAKIATDFNKPRGITYVYKHQEKSFLSPLPVSVIPGIGKVTTASLNRKGIKFIRDITSLPQEFFTDCFGLNGYDIWQKAHGEGSINFAYTIEQKSISKETTFSDDILEKEILFHYLFKLTGKVCQTLRDQNALAGTVGIKLRYNDFNTLTRVKSLRFTNDDQTIYQTARELLDKAFTRRVAVRLIGVSLTNFTHDVKQLEMFNDMEKRRERVIDALNIIRGKYGFGTIQFGRDE